jgi:circadian clock protein KaiC
MSHSNQIREYQITSHGIQLLDVYRSVGGVLVGSARRQAQAVAQRKSRAAANGKNGINAKFASKTRRRSKVQGKSP